MYNTSVKTKNHFGCSERSSKSENSLVNNENNEPIEIEVLCCLTSWRGTSCVPTDRKWERGKGDVYILHRARFNGSETRFFFWNIKKLYDQKYKSQSVVIVIRLSGYWSLLVLLEFMLSCPRSHHYHHHRYHHHYHQTITTTSNITTTTIISIAITITLPP